MYFTDGLISEEEEISFMNMSGMASLRLMIEYSAIVCVMQSLSQTACTIHYFDSHPSVVIRDVLLEIARSHSDSALTTPIYVVIHFDICHAKELCANLIPLP